LKSIFIHGNVCEIACDAFDGLPGLTIEAYHGSAAFDYAASKGLSYRNLSAFSFVPGLIDYSYIVLDRFVFSGNGTVKLRSLEASRLSKGSVFYLSASAQYPDGEAFKVLTIVLQGDWCIQRY
jgi:hypothetical protein